MNAATMQRDLLMPRPADAVGAGLVLAVLAHLLLIAALAFGVHWRTQDDTGYEAELWAAVPQVAAPRAAEPEPRPAPAVKAPEPPRAEPKAAERTDAQIAIEKAKRDEAKRDEARREEEATKKKAAQEEAERKKKELAEKKAQEDKDKRNQATVDAQRVANLKRMQGLAGASGDENARGSALHDAAPTAGYAGRIRARVKPNVVFTDNLDGNPPATVEVRVAPDGTIVGRKLVKSSGVAGWDEAVLRAIDKTEVLPRDTDGRVPPRIEITFRPRD